MKPERLLTLKNKVRGHLLGTAVGDALGMPIEGMRRKDIKEKFGNITGFLDFSSRYSQGLTRGQWTDDTKLTLATIEGISEACTRRNLILVRHKTIEKYLSAFQEHKRGFGKTTQESLQDRLDNKSPFAGQHEKRPGNGCAMRSAPIGIFFGLLEAVDGLFLREDFEEMVVMNALITHNDSRSIVAAGVQAYAALLALRGQNLQHTAAMAALVQVARRFEKMVNDGEKDSPRVSDVLELIPHLIAKDNEFIIHILGDGSASYESFPLALAFAIKYQDDFRSAVLAGVNAGGDTDTIAAMTGAIVGARLGAQAIPQEWLRDLEARSDLIWAADLLWGTAAWLGEFASVNKE